MTKGFHRFHWSSSPFVWLI